MGTVPQTALYPALTPPARRLGDDLAPPRQVYFTFIPAILALGGIGAWVLGDDMGMVLASLVATAVALFTMWEWLFSYAPTRFSTLMGMGLLLGYGFGTLNTWITLPRGSLTLGDIAGLQEGVLAHGLAAVLLSASALYFFGELYEKPVFGRDFRFEITSRTRLLVYAGTFAMLVGYEFHFLDVGGASGGGGHASKPGMFLAWLYSPLTCIAVMALVASRRKVDIVLTGISTIILLAMFSVMGRRITIYTSMEILLVLGISGFRWRDKLLRNVLVLLALASIMAVTSLSFMLLRITSSNLRTRHFVPLGKRIEAVGNVVRKTGVRQAYATAGAGTQSNFQTRTFVLAFLADIQDASSRMTPALGQDAIAQVQQAIPSALYPDKPKHFAEEGLVDQVFGLSYGDQANSILTVGAADFGLIGMLVYPLVLALAIRLCFALLSNWLSVVPLMFVALALIVLVVQTEMPLTGYCEIVRDSFVFTIPIALFMRFPSITMRAS